MGVHAQPDVENAGYWLFRVGTGYMAGYRAEGFPTPLLLKNQYQHYLFLGISGLKSVDINN